MPQSFLHVARQKEARDNVSLTNAKQQQNGNGNGLPDGENGQFMFATGIECSSPTINNGRTRRDSLQECNHYTHWKTDLQLVRDTGLRVLRYGLPIHRTFLGPGRYDWEFTDQAISEMQKLEIIPILDLCHFGLPDFLGNFQNPEWPAYFAEYAGAVAARYPHVRYYTPVNEVFVTARNSARDGIWNEQEKTDKAFVTCLKHLCAASIMATHQIAKCRPDCIIVQAESAEHLHEACTEPSPHVTLWNKINFLSLDLLYGIVPEADVLLWCMDNGLTCEEYDWFMQGEPPGFQVMGNDYYGRNEQIRLPDGSSIQSEDVYGWYYITSQFYQRYHKPVFHTETNVFDPNQAPTWLWKQWVNVLRMRRDGVPVLGFTWYSLTDQMDWDTQLSEKNGNVNECGLYDLQRQPRLVQKAYRQLLENFGRITVVPHAELFTITDRDARLKVEV